MDSFNPGYMTKTITFRRLSLKNVLRYEIYATYRDATYTSGLRRELLDTIENPTVPNPCVKRIELKYNTDTTWRLPEDAYLDRDHKFRLYLDGIMVTSMAVSFNRLTKLITLDSVMKTCDLNTKIEMEYYQDLISKDYLLEQDCQIFVKPIFSDSYRFGFHNVII